MAHSFCNEPHVGVTTSTTATINNINQRTTSSLLQ
jgi:hypothetical protein